MGIEDIQISEELETNAPSIRYKGNEGPKSPQQIEEMMMQQMQEMDQIQNQEADNEELMTAEIDILREEYLKYVFDMEEQGLQPMSFREFLDQAMAEGQMSKGPVLPNDPTEPVNPFKPKPTGPVLPDRLMAGTDTPEMEIELLKELLEEYRAIYGRDPVSIDELKKALGQSREKAAYGGIMGLDGRRQYGLGSSLKKFVRKVIPNEVAEIAVKAAPFVAPFNPLAAGLMSGIGSFDQTGRIGSSLKSGLMNYGLGQAGRYLGGADFQTGINPLGGFTPGTTGTGTLSQYFSKPTGSGGIKNLFADKAASTPALKESTYNALLDDEIGADNFLESMVKPKQIVEKQSKSILGDLPKLIKDNLSKVGLGNNLVSGLLVGGLGASALMGNMTEEEISETMGRGEGLDIEGIRTEVLEAMKDPTGEALKAIRIKYPFLGTRKSKDLTGLANGGRIGFEFGKRVPPVKMPDPLEQMLQNMTDEEKAQFKLMMRMNAERMPKYQPDPNAIPPVKMPTYPRVDRAEGGIMDLGGMEKDYRAEGGFVPIGKEEKADDVPARLSVNEFVFTADAVRNAGGGDIDKGAEVMENMMKNLEAGGQVSEESQGLAGAQQMFETSERLSEVI